tara:strand:- start:4775 stop:6817 length:2043 start_codon:yes stop_codon:yes gene_type:complete
MQGIMSGMEPVRLKKGGFPDLTGDGKVTQKDILRGRGIEGFANGGDADKRFMNLQRTAEGSGANLRDFTDLVFDPTDPVDYAIAGLMVFPPAAIAAKLIKLGVKGNKLKDKMKKVETIKNAQRSMGTKAKDLFTTNPIDNMAAANGLILGGTRATALGATGQLALRNELADMATTNERTISRIGPAELYSYEARDQIREDPSLVKKGGIGEYVEIAKMVPEFYDIAKDPEGREAMAEVIKESLPSMPNVFGTVDSEILSKKDGGIIGFAKGGAVKKGGKTFLDKTKKKIKLKKDGTPDKRYKVETKTPDKPKSSGTKINEKLKPKKQTPAQKKAAAERKRKANLKKAEKKRQADIDAKAKADAAARRKADADEFNQSRQQTPATKLDDTTTGGTPKTGGGVPEGDLPKQGFFQNPVPYLSPNIFNPATKAKGTKAILAGAALIPGMLRDSDGSEQDRPIKDDVIITDDNIFDSDTDAVIPDRDPSAWADIMKNRLITDQGFQLDDKGNFVDKPKFRNYLKSLPGAYADKVQRDPDFAKKMMAGFLNMMKPVEGYVPINPAVAFGEGYLGEETRQADMLPADAKMLQFLQANPDLYDKYLESESAKAGVLLADIKAEQGTALYNQLVDTAAVLQNIPLDQIAAGNYQLTYRGIPIGPSQITALLGQGVSIVGNSDFKLEIK